MPIIMIEVCRRAHNSIIVEMKFSSSYFFALDATLGIVMAGRLIDYVIRGDSQKIKVCKDNGINVDA